MNALFPQNILNETKVADVFEVCNRAYPEGWQNTIFTALAFSSLQESIVFDSRGGQQGLHQNYQ